jgi:hypothetical protein
VVREVGRSDGRREDEAKVEAAPRIITAPDAHGELARVERALSKNEDPFPIRIDPTSAEALFLKWTGMGNRAACGWRRMDVDETLHNSRVRATDMGRADSKGSW